MDFQSIVLNLFSLFIKYLIWSLPCFQSQHIHSRSFILSYEFNSLYLRESSNHVVICCKSLCILQSVKKNNVGFFLIIESLWVYTTWRLTFHDSSFEPNDSLWVLPNLFVCFHTFCVLNLEQWGSHVTNNDPSSKLNIRVPIPGIMNLLPKIKYGLPYRDNIPMKNNK
jgi:hypothetical protein